MLAVKDGAVLPPPGMSIALVFVSEGPSFAVEVAAAIAAAFVRDSVASVAPSIPRVVEVAAAAAVVLAVMGADCAAAHIAAKGSHAAPSVREVRAKSHKHLLQLSCSWRNRQGVQPPGHCYPLE